MSTKTDIEQSLASLSEEKLRLLDAFISALDTDIATTAETANPSTSEIDLKKLVSNWAATLNDTALVDTKTKPHSLIAGVKQTSANSSNISKNDLLAMLTAYFDNSGEYMLSHAWFEVIEHT